MGRGPECCVAIFLALISALVYGTADFTGGIATKRNGLTLPVVVFSQLSGWVVVVALIPVLPTSHPHLSDVWWGLASGVAGSTGLMFFYRGLARGAMSIVSPVASAVSAVIPVVGGLLAGDAPAALALAGVVLGVVAVGLLGTQPMASHHDALDSPMKSFVGALCAGCGFGGFFVLLHHTSHNSGLWPLFFARLGSATLLITLSLARRQPIKLVRGAVRITLIAGAIDMAANAVYLVVSHMALLSIIGVIVALYPISTLVLARFVLHERVSKIQAGALVLAGISVSMIALA